MCIYIFHRSVPRADHGDSQTERSGRGARTHVPPEQEREHPGTPASRNQFSAVVRGLLAGGGDGLAGTTAPLLRTCTRLLIILVDPLGGLQDRRRSRGARTGDRGARGPAAPVRVVTVRRSVVLIIRWFITRTGLLSLGLVVLRAELLLRVFLVHPRGRGGTPRDRGLIITLFGGRTTGLRRGLLPPKLLLSLRREVRHPLTVRGELGEDRAGPCGELLSVVVRLETGDQVEEHEIVFAGQPVEGRVEGRSRVAGARNVAPLLLLPGVVGTLTIITTIERRA